MTDVTETPSAGGRDARRGREARRAARSARGAASIPYITRNLPLTEVLTEEGLALIEHNAETLLEEIGIEFRDYPTAL
jgi:trimethylamine--corrinoid protein Co-methyltransferase